ncbi:MAG TPA: dienelactone hydrolase [Chryseolinea sp.]|nr:dienelactone hydrolase [Chryseolinea sp.]
MKRKQIIPALVIFCMGVGQAFGQLKTNEVGQRTLAYEDHSRNRKLTTEVWYPTLEKASPEDASPFIRISTKRDAAISQGIFPLILFSHGTGGGRLTVEWFCAGLASKGFIVAAVDHFGNTFDNPIPIEFIKFWERPQDIRFVLDQLLGSHDISSHVDPNKIGAAGFSLGGFTAITLAGAKMDFQAIENYLKSEQGKKEADIPEMPGLISLFGKPEVKESFEKARPLVDKRIKSVFAMSPAIGQAFPTKENCKDVSAPVYIVAAAKDMLAPPKTNAVHYAKLIRNAQYKILGTEAGHYVFLNEAKDGLKQEAPMFFNDPPGVNRKKIHDEALQLATDHFRKTLK